MHFTVKTLLLWDKALLNVMKTVYQWDKKHKIYSRMHFTTTLHVNMHRIAA